MCFFLLSSRLLGPLIVTRALSAEARASAEAGGSVEALVLVFFFVAMWSCQNELRMGAKTVGVGYPSEQRNITTTRFGEGEASRKQITTTITSRKSMYKPRILYSMSH